MRAIYPPLWDSLRSEGFDPLGVWHRVAGDMGLLRDLTRTFAIESRQMLQDIERAIQQSDVAALQKAVHRLRGSLLQFAAPIASAAAADVQRSVAGASKHEAAHAFEKLKVEIDSLTRKLLKMTSEAAIESGQTVKVG